MIGIIAVQLYWINNALESKKAQFKNDVQKSLGAATEKVNERERAEFEKKLKSFVDVKGFARKKATMTQNTRNYGAIHGYFTYHLIYCFRFFIICGYFL